MNRREKTILISIFLHLTVTVALLYFLTTKLNLHPAVAYFLSLNLITFLSFGKDKQAAQMEMPRTPEMTFHLLGLFGAFPAIFIGRKVFRHKTVKTKFIYMMWLFFFIQITVVYLLF